MSSIFQRRSIRKYQDRPVEPEKIETLLRAAMAAPSAQNQQPWEYYVIADPLLKQKLSMVSQYATPANDAPVVFVACYRTDGKAGVYAPIDMAASVENILLRAVEVGLGTCWIGVAPREERMKKVAEILALPDALKPFATIACGYPAEQREPVDRYDPTRVHYL